MPFLFKTVEKTILFSFYLKIDAFMIKYAILNYVFKLIKVKTSCKEKYEPFVRVRIIHVRCITRH